MKMKDGTTFNIVKRDVMGLEKVVDGMHISDATISKDPCISQEFSAPHSPHQNVKTARRDKFTKELAPQEPIKESIKESEPVQIFIQELVPGEPPAQKLVIKEPVEGAEGEPVEGAEGAPVDGAGEPVDSDEEPVDGAGEPVDSDEEPVDGAEESQEQQKLCAAYDVSDEDSEVGEIDYPFNGIEIQPSYNRNIFDTELSDEEERRSHHSDEDDQMELSKSKKKKPKEPTQKDRDKERLEIASESQRMQREATFSLPYHKPKQRSLAEFLNRRKTKPPIASTMRGSLKMSMRNPEVLKQLVSRKKDLEEFYKSDDEGAEDPEDAEWKPGMEPKKTDSDKDSDDSDMETDTEKSISEAKLDSAHSESKDNEISLIANEVGVHSRNDIVSSDSKDEVNATPGTIVDELPDIDTEKNLNLNINKDPSEISSTSTEEKMQLEERESLTQSCNAEESKSDAEQAKLSNDKIADGLITEPSKSEITSAGASKTQVDDSGIQSGSSSSNEDHDSNDATVNKSTSIANEKLAETSTPGDDNTEAENIDTKDNSLQGTPSLQNKEDDASKNNTPKLALLATKIPTLDLKATPKLGLGTNSGDFIDLEDATPKDKAGLDSFVDRFIKHSKTKRAKAGKRQVNLGVVQKVKGADGEENLESSSICIELEEDEDHTINEEVPGAKRVTLKQALKAKMREQREQERLRRHKEKKFMDSEDIEGEDAILDDEDEGDFTDKSESEYETESEPEENDIIINDKKRKKNKFLDEEADEDEMEDDTGDNDAEDENDNDAVIDGNDDSNDTVVLGSRPSKKIEEDDEEEDCNTNGEDLHLQWEDTQDVNKGLHRTETQDMFASQSIDKHPKKIDSADKDISMTSMDSSFEFFGSVIPAHQPGGGMKNPKRSHLNSESQDNSTAGFLTPLLKQKTDSLGSVSKGCDLSLPFENSQELCSTPSVSANPERSQSPTGVSLQLTPMDNSQFVSKDSNSSPTSKLRLDFVGATQTQVTQQGTTDELVGLCSGQFTGKTQDAKKSNLYDDDDDDDMAATQNIEDLMGLCSGRFNTQATGDDADNKTKGTSTGAFSQLFDTANKSTMEDDDLIGLCTGKFTTIININAPHCVGNFASNKQTSPVLPPKLAVSEKMEFIRKFKKNSLKKHHKTVKRIFTNFTIFITHYKEEHTTLLKLIKFSVFSTPSREEVTSGIRRDFLDAEAELSGSEDEVSDDEEEGEDDDFMEMEAGDAENYDDNELRDQVGRAHMKAEMDADKRRLRLLQEMYLENGDLHGEGRQRSFKWRNNDDENDDSNQRTVSDEEDNHEEETEDTEWRKQRYEREKFLEEQTNAVKDGENEPDIFKIGASLVRTTSVKSTKREPLKPSNPPVAPTNMPAPNPASTRPTAPSNPFCMPSKRGSFLSRNKSTLAKIAELTKDKGSTVGGAKQGGNFVFQQLSSEEVEAQKEQAETKLNRSVSAPAMKKARLDRSFFSLDETKQKSSIFKHL
ncbi:unnamed protein product, partial [Meganyctiphanes norvegica]